MSKYLRIKQWPSSKFKRRVGINKGAFEVLVKELEKQIEEDKGKKPKSKRGKKTTLLIEDQLLLFLFYLRSYKTFLELGDDFAISEGYANKVFHKICKRMIKILKLPSSTELSREGLKAVVIDASEQPIERPIKKQKDYYSGKKTPYHKSTAGNMLDNVHDYKS